MGKCKLASTYQNEHTELALDLIDYLSKYYVSNSLCLAGSVFSNPKTFTKVYKRIPFDRIYAPPFLEDDGLSIGCAWWAFVKYSNRPSNIEFNSSVGKQYTSDEILKDLQFIDDVFSNDILDRYELLEFNNDADLSKNVATLLKQNKIVGIFKGKCDSGYTSLGNRSILANPTSRITTDYILRFVKEDEWYVKYGVSILDTKINQVFENDIYSPYMLVQSKVKNNWKYKAPGLITAQDNLLYHSVMQSRNPFLFDVISNFNTLCDVPMVLNVNLSSKNDPMDYTPYDAIKTMYTKKLSALVLENMMLVQKQLL
jgi:carbamoyltransferase